MIFWPALLGVELTSGADKSGDGGGRGCRGKGSAGLGPCHIRNRGCQRGFNGGGGLGRDCDCGGGVRGGDGTDHGDEILEAGKVPAKSKEE
jgi:hypothetical protein